MNEASPTASARIGEGLFAGLAFGLADWLAAGMTDAPVELLLVLLAGALLGGLLAGVLATLLRLAPGGALGLALLGVLLFDAAAYASRELHGPALQVGFLVVALLLGVLAARLAPRSWSRRPYVLTAFCLLGVVPAVDLARRWLELGPAVAFLGCTVPPVAAALLARSAILHRLMFAALLVGLCYVLNDERDAAGPYRAADPLAADSARPGPDAPDVCLIVVDTLRADHLPGDGSPETGAFARLAARGVRFDQAVASAPWTLPSMASLLTSLHPTQHGAMTLARPLPPDVPTLAERFRDAGYDTAAFTGGAFVSVDYGLHRGFRHFDGDAEYRFRLPRLHTPLLWQVVRNRWFPQRWLLAHVRAFGGVAELGERLVRWLDEREARRPFFLLVHSYEVHDYYLYDPPADDGLRNERPSPFGRRLSVHPDELFGLAQDELDWFQAVYRARIDHVDRELARILGRLEAASDRPLVVALTSDHGEGFDAVHRRVHHGGRLHDDLLRVPLLLAAPGLEAGRVVEEQVRTLDLGPTLLELAGLPAPGDVAGRSLVDALTGAAEWPSPAWSEERGEKRALRTARWKILASGTERTLHDLEADPLELSENAVPVERFPAPLLESWQAFPTLYPPRIVDDQAIDEDTLAELRALGYVD